MGRTNLIILFFGLFACVALSLMMKHVVGIKDKKDVHPGVLELHNLFGDQLRRRPTLEVSTRHGQEIAVLTVHPKGSGSKARLARTLGRYILHFRGQDLTFDRIEVVAKGNGTDPDQTIDIAVPKRRRDVSRRARSRGKGRPSGRSTRSGNQRRKAGPPSPKTARKGWGGSKPAKTTSKDAAKDAAKKPEKNSAQPTHPVPPSRPPGKGK